MENDRGSSAFSVAEPLENIGQLVGRNLAEERGAIPSLTSPTRGWAKSMGTRRTSGDDQ
jgi:hypothetical protein